MSLDVKLEDSDGNIVYEYNITHNLSKMADNVKDGLLYKLLWRPEEIGCEYAFQITLGLTECLCELALNKEKYVEFNPPNGWGSYDGLLKFCADYLSACKKYPECSVKVCR